MFALCRAQHHTEGEHPEILAGIGEGYRKSGFRRTKALIYPKRGKIGPRLQLGSHIHAFDWCKNQRPHMSFKRDLRSLIDTTNAVKLTKCVRDVEVS